MHGYLNVLWFQDFFLGVERDPMPNFYVKKKKIPLVNKNFRVGVFSVKRGYLSQKLT